MNDSQIIKESVRQALAEDLGPEDVTAALIPSGRRVKARLINREPLLVCGQAWVNETMHQIDPAIQIDWQVGEGDWISEPKDLAYFEGEARALLTAERTALNFLQTLSATATQTHHYVQKLSGTGTKVLDTRKTIPGLRYAQKYAVRCAGGVNHRFGLYDAYLIKENHIRACGSISQAIATARRLHPQLMVEVEVETLEEFTEALSAKPDRILLDNFDFEQMVRAVHMNQPKVCDLETSGGIDLNNLAQIAATGVDYISVGALTKSVKAIDLSFLVMMNNKSD